MDKERNEIIGIDVESLDAVILNFIEIEDTVELLEPYHCSCKYECKSL